MLTALWRRISTETACVLVALLVTVGAGCTQQPAVPVGGPSLPPGTVLTDATIGYKGQGPGNSVERGRPIVVTGRFRFKPSENVPPPTKLIVQGKDSKGVIFDSARAVVQKVSDDEYEYSGELDGTGAGQYTVEASSPYDGNVFVRGELVIP